MIGNFISRLSKFGCERKAKSIEFAAGTSCHGSALVSFDARTAWKTCVESIPMLPAKLVGHR